MKKYKVYGIGAALVDTEIKVEDQELTQMGVEKGLMTLVDQDRQAELIGNLEGHLVKAKNASGGSAGNSMIGTALFGGPTFMSCKVANDSDGDIYIADMEAAGVNHCWSGPRESGITGKCLVMISPDAERSMNTYLGISETLSVEQVDEGAIADSEYLYLEGYLVTSPTGRAAAIKAREVAEAAGVKTSLSFSDPGMVEFFRDGIAEMLGKRVDLIFCNRDEALGWAQSDNIDEAVAAPERCRQHLCHNARWRRRFDLRRERSSRDFPAQSRGCRHQRCWRHVRRRLPLRDHKWRRLFHRRPLCQPRGEQDCRQLWTAPAGRRIRRTAQGIFR